jgi:outer membrane lipoprotein SlyB
MNQGTISASPSTERLTMKPGSLKMEPISVRDWLLSPTTTAGALMGGTIGAYAGGPAGAVAGVLLGGVTGAVYGYVVDSASGRHDHGGKTSASHDRRNGS